MSQYKRRDGETREAWAERVTHLPKPYGSTPATICPDHGGRSGVVMVNPRKGKDREPYPIYRCPACNTEAAAGTRALPTVAGGLW